MLKKIYKEINKEIDKNKKFLEIIYYSDEAYVETLLYVDVLSNCKNQIKAIIKANGTVEDVVKFVEEQKEKTKQEASRIEYRFLKTICAALAFVEKLCYKE